jgi:hypothetical protein
VPVTAAGSPQTGIAATNNQPQATSPNAAQPQSRAVQANASGETGRQFPINLVTPDPHHPTNHLGIVNRRITRKAVISPEATAAEAPMNDQSVAAHVHPHAPGCHGTGAWQDVDLVSGAKRRQHAVATNGQPPLGMRNDLSPVRGIEDGGANRLTVGTDGGVWGGHRLARLYGTSPDSKSTLPPVESIQAPSKSRKAASSGFAAAGSTVR